MKIAFDLQIAENDPAGIGQYTLNLLNEFVKIAPQHKFYSYSTTPLLLNLVVNRVIKVNASLPFKGLRYIKAASKAMKSDKIDLLISTGNHSFSKYFHPTLQFIHDLAPIHYPQFFPKSAVIKYKRNIHNAVDNASYLATISNTVASEIRTYFNIPAREILVLPPGINKWIAPIKNYQPILEKYSIDYPYLLMLSTLEPRKNHENMIKALHLLKKGKNFPYKLVIVGKKGWFFERIFDTVRELNLQNEVFFPGYVPNEDLSALIQQAQLFVMPSFYEGFGIPPLEALMLGTPIVVSDIPVFREIYQDCALYADPHHPEELANAIKTKINSTNRCESAKITDIFTYANTAGKLAAFIDGKFN